MPLEWSSRYDVHSAEVPPLGVLQVARNTSRSDPGYVVTVFGVRAGGNWENLATAKRHAVSLARRALAEASAILGAEPT